jgi:hypothetical protein
MKRTVFLAVALFALMAVGLYAQTETDFEVSKSADGKSITIDKYKGSATTVVIPARIQNLPVTEIENQAFWVTSPVTSVTIPNTVTSIKSGAFICALTSVTFQGTIPASGFHAAAFGSGTSSLGDIRDKYLAAGGGAGTYTRPDTNSKTWTKSASAAAAPVVTGTTLLAFTAINSNKEYSVNKGTLSSGDVFIPDSYNNLPVTAIAANGFTGLLIRSLTIPNSVKTIGNNAFANCGALTSVTIPSSVTSIGNNAFINCNQLTSVTIQGTIPSNSFFGFDGDLKTKYLAGGAGTYTRPSGGTTWTKK